jgi:hypothetical protein
MDLLNKRDGHRTLFAFSSYFCVQLAIGGFCYENVENWTTRARVDVFALERLLFPVNVDKVHWTLAVINLKLRRFEYYDSLGGTNQTALSNLRLWLNEESKAKREVELELSDWEDFCPTGRGSSTEQPLRLRRVHAAIRRLRRLVRAVRLSTGWPAKPSPLGDATAFEAVAECLTNLIWASTTANKPCIIGALDYQRKSSSSISTLPWP